VGQVGDGSRSARRPTMTDVAAHAGVSLKTVSRVVNGEPHVSPDLAERVRASIHALGFRRDASARQLAMGAAGRLLGYIQVDAANPFFGAVARGLEEVTLPHGFLVITGSTDADPEREGVLLDALVEARVAGIVVAAAEGGDEILRQELDHGTAIVCVDRLLDGATCDVVTSTNRASTRTAVQHLLDLGHRRIAYLGGTPTVWSAQERRQGYLDALTAAGIGADPGLLIEHVDTSTLAAAATTRLLEHDAPPTAIVAGQDRIGIGLIEALHRHAAQHEVAHIVFDDLPLGGQLEPPVAVVRQDATELGRAAGRLLLQRLDDGTTAPARRIEIPAAFEPRRSASIPPPAIDEPDRSP
jgi:LacI family transcriptional regulator